jgi:ATP synthase F1 complex assembly factor 2
MKAAAKRFYDKVAVKAASASGWGVALDGKLLRTPAKRTLEVPTEALALGIAVEWEKQGEKLRPDTMPLMKLATTAIDQVPDIRPTMVDSMVRCVECDLACFRSAEEQALAAKEEEALGPLLRWLADDLDLHLAVTDTMFLQQPAAAVPRVHELLAEADDWELAALDSMTGVCKSFVIAMAVSRSRIGAAEACLAARVGEQHQIDEWGEVEAGHDLDAADLRVRMAASSTFLRLLRRREPAA